jgi:hypothetical protein
VVTELGVVEERVLGSRVGLMDGRDDETIDGSKAERDGEMIDDDWVGKLDGSFDDNEVDGSVLSKAEGRHDEQMDVTDRTEEGSALGTLDECSVNIMEGTFDGIITGDNDGTLVAYADDDTKLNEKIKSPLLGIVDRIELGNKVGIAGNKLFGSIKGDLEGFRDCINDGNELGRCEGIVGSCDGRKDIRLNENWNKKSGDLELGDIMNGIVDSTFFTDGEIVGISEGFTET